MKRIGILMLGFLFCFAVAAWPQVQPQFTNKIITNDVPGASTGASAATTLTLLGSNPKVLQYKFETVDAPNSSSTWDNWVNDSGMIGQDYTDAAGNAHYAVRINGTWQVLEVPGAVMTLGANPNNLSQVALMWFDSNWNGHLAVWQEGRPLKYVPAMPPNPPSGSWGEIGYYDWSGPNGFNDLGIATSWTFLTWTLPELAYGLLQNTITGQYQLLVYPGSDILWTNPQTTNDWGTTVGCYETLTNESHAFTWDGRKFTNIDVPGGTNQCAYFINIEGYIAGGYTNASGAAVGYVRDPMGGVTDFNVPQALQTVPLGITDNFEVSGIYQGQDQEWHGFVATPQ